MAQHNGEAGKGKRRPGQRKDEMSRWKWTAAIGKKIAELVSSGMAKTPAAKLCGVPPATILGWLDAGENALKAREQGQKIEGIHAELADFAVNLTQAYAAAEQARLTVVEEAARGQDLTRVTRSEEQIIIDGLPIPIRGNDGNPVIIDGKPIYQSIIRTTVTRETRKDWRAAAWLLAIADPERYGRAYRFSGKIRHDHHVILSDEDRAVASRIASSRLQLAE